HDARSGREKSVDVLDGTNAFTSRDRGENRHPPPPRRLARPLDAQHEREARLPLAEPPALGALLERLAQRREPPRHRAGRRPPPPPTGDGLLVLALLVLLTFTATDVALPGNAEQERFEGFFTKGEQLYGQGEYGAAIWNFREADSIRLTPEVAFDLAKCHEKI